MKVFTNNKFTGRWPVGTAAVVVAPDQEAAAIMMMQCLEKMGMPQTIPEADMVELNTDIRTVLILADGEY
ncbi:gp038 [Erwinia phage vB_EamP-S6]|uniref:Gp038 n=1 Tax=Erwinia phage vB_EamP-S6 TaxID=1051675 RepID=G0YQD0_9CAUD|nr:gp038 [Erwinia phage vB_EamP-S6]AEJ81557.1 gp038 [Erwinia phage vB_EamP-S6]